MSLFGAKLKFLKIGTMSMLARFLDSVECTMSLMLVYFSNWYIVKVLFDSFKFLEAKLKILELAQCLCLQGPFF